MIDRFAAVSMTARGIVAAAQGQIDSMTLRRMLIAIAGFWMFAAAVTGNAQTNVAAPRIVWVSNLGEQQNQSFKASFLDGMRQAGQVEGRTFQLVVRHASGDPGRAVALIRETVAERPAVIVVTGLTNARVAHDATKTIPIVVGTSSDLVDAGIVKSYARPGGNITGVSDLADETAVKRLELLKAALPNASRVAVLLNPDFPATPKIESRVKAAADALRVTIIRVDARDRASLARTLDAVGKLRPDALLATDALAVANADELIEQATALRVPVVHLWPGTVERGALFSYQADVTDNFRRAAGYVDKILNGANPGDLPIFQPTRYELVVNAKVARAFGLTLAPTFLGRADRVID